LAIEKLAGYLEVANEEQLVAFLSLISSHT